jgi:hypothetical protein
MKYLVNINDDKAFIAWGNAILKAVPAKPKAKKIKKKRKK